jgi:hypothetical protein
MGGRGFQERRHLFGGTDFGEGLAGHIAIPGNSGCPTWWA